MFEMDDRDRQDVLGSLWGTTVRFLRDRLLEAAGLALIALAVAMTLALSTYNPMDPSFNNATTAEPWNLLGLPGARFADVVMQVIGLGAMAMIPPLAVAGWWLFAKQGPGSILGRIGAWLLAIIFTSTLAASLPFSAPEPLQTGLGGMIGDWCANLLAGMAAFVGLAEPKAMRFVSGFIAAIGALVAFAYAIGLQFGRFRWGLDETAPTERRAPRADPFAARREAEDATPADRGWGPGVSWAGLSIAGLSFAGLGAWIGGLWRRREVDPGEPFDASVVAPHDRDVPWKDGPILPAHAQHPRPQAPEPAVYDDLPDDHHNEADQRQSYEDEEPAPPPFAPPPPEAADANWDDEGDWDEDTTQAKAPAQPEAEAEAKSGWSLSRLLPSNPLRSLSERIRIRAASDEAGERPVAYDDDGAPLEDPPMPSGPPPQAAPRGAAAFVADTDEPDAPPPPTHGRVKRGTARLAPGKRANQDRQPALALEPLDYALPSLSLLRDVDAGAVNEATADDVLEENARLLETVLQDFGIRGEIIHVRPGPVVTLYELEPAPGIKSARVIGLADDIARSMSAVSARVAVIPGRNVIGIELPNKTREMVLLRELLAADSYERAPARLALALGKDIGGEPVIADLATMPHLLIAGTTGSGKSVAINTMILSILYRMPPSQCRLILIDPKMLELSVYEGIPHLLSPVVTDPKKAVVALKWVVREMEARYRKMSKLGVRNIRGFNERVKEAARRDEVLTRSVQTGFDKETGEPIYEQEELPLEPMPFIVVGVDEMADLMMVAGKDIEGAVQRLAQMARAAGIHLITATQRPSVDVITGTIKANFPTRISFQVTSKIDSRTILGEQGAEQLLGQGDMLYMAGGGRIRRVHGPFVSDDEVEDVVAELKAQGAPAYVDGITEEDDDDPQTFLDMVAGGGDDSGDDLYDRAVAIVARDRKASTSYIQRKLQIGYNRAARLIERMEDEGVVSSANHVGKREVLVQDHSGYDD